MADPLPNVGDLRRQLRPGETLVRLEIRRDRMPGVYFLCLNGIVQYTGQAVDVLRRVCDHKLRTDFDWDLAYWIECPETELTALERHWIDTLRPPFNTDPASMSRRGIIRAVYAADGQWIPKNDLRRRELITRDEHKRRKKLHQELQRRGEEPFDYIQLPPDWHN